MSCSKSPYGVYDNAGTCWAICADCTHGVADASGGCVCEPGWTGESCDTCALGYAGSACQFSRSNTCNNHGDPAYDGSCTCDAGWAGSLCQFSDATTCNAHGVVSSLGACTCDAGWAGVNCQFSSASNCSGNGRVQADGSCVCDAGYGGRSCEWTNAEACNDNGQVQEDHSCECDPGYGGDRCELHGSTTCSGRGSLKFDDGSNDWYCECTNNWSGGDCNTCGVGFAGGDCQFSDAENCGGNGAVNADGTCGCDKGFNGPECQFSDDRCSGNGEVNSVGACVCGGNWGGQYCTVCQTGFAGDDCQYSDALTCSGHGVVNADGTCVCDQYYTDGDNCQIARMISFPQTLQGTHWDGNEAAYTFPGVTPEYLVFTGLRTPGETSNAWYGGLAGSDSFAIYASNRNGKPQALSTTSTVNTLLVRGGLAGTYMESKTFGGANPPIMEQVPSGTDMFARVVKTTDHAHWSGGGVQIPIYNGESDDFDVYVNTRTSWASGKERAGAWFAADTLVSGAFFFTIHALTWDGATSGGFAWNMDFNVLFVRKTGDNDIFPLFSNHVDFKNPLDPPPLIGSLTPPDYLSYRARIDYSDWVGGQVTFGHSFADQYDIYVKLVNANGTGPGWYGATATGEHEFTIYAMGTFEHGSPGVAFTNYRWHNDFHVLLVRR